MIPSDTTQTRLINAFFSTHTPLICCAFRVGEIIRVQPARPGGQSCAAGRVGANRPPDPGGDQPQSDAVQHLSVILTPPQHLQLFTYCPRADWLGFLMVPNVFKHFKTLLPDDSLSVL